MEEREQYLGLAVQIKEDKKGGAEGGTGLMLVAFLKFQYYFKQFFCWLPAKKLLHHFF